MIPSIDQLLFTTASHLTEPAERRAFLEFACRGDEARLGRILELLNLHDVAEQYFEVQTTAAITPSREEGEGGEVGLDAYIGPYRLIDRLGTGGCGVVYLAEQQEPVRRKVALKIIRLGMDTEHVIERFNLEREAVALMDHPNIASVLDAGVTGAGRPFFVMELVDGERITDYCDQGKLGIRERLELFIRVCDAIQHAHQKGVIHRDIKPSNILVREQGGCAVPKVIDFGIAKATAGELNAVATALVSGQFIGTPAYMSPEQAEGGSDIDTRSDIYSLGALLSEILTGQPPYTAETFTEGGVDRIRKILREEGGGVPSSRLSKIPAGELEEIAKVRGVESHRLRSLLTGDLDWIVLKATERDRSRRYETANGLAMDVQRYLNEEAVLARPPSRRYLLGKIIKRNRLVFAAASVALFGLLSGFGVSTWLFLRERHARQEQARLRTVAEQARAYEVELREQAMAADLVSQAAVLLKFNEWEKADELIAQLVPEKTPLSREAVNTVASIARWNARKHRWQTGAQRFNILAHMLTRIDLADSKTITQELSPAAAMLSEWGTEGQYPYFRKKAFERFGNSASPDVSEQVLKATLLEPVDEETLLIVERLVNILKDSIKPGGETDPHLVSWRQFSLALAAYRQGRFDEAKEWALTSNKIKPTRKSRTAGNRIILAMVKLKMEKAEEARSSLKKLREEVDRWAESEFGLFDPDGSGWYNWVVVRVLVREAEGMLAEHDAAAGK